MRLTDNGIYTNVRIQPERPIPCMCSTSIVRIAISPSVGRRTLVPYRVSESTLPFRTAPSYPPQTMQVAPPFHYLISYLLYTSRSHPPGPLGPLLWRRMPLRLSLPRRPLSLRSHAHLGKLDLAHTPLKRTREWVYINGLRCISNSLGASACNVN